MEVRVELSRLCSPPMQRFNSLTCATETAVSGHFPNAQNHARENRDHPESARVSVLLDSKRLSDHFLGGLEWWQMLSCLIAHHSVPTLFFV
jgi:hypothetical protein